MKCLPMFIAIATVALAGCGRMAPLTPPPGKPLPVRPAVASTTPTAKDLLTPPTQARPDRVDELIKRSLPRREDPFDLPPPTGGPAPVLPSDPGPQPDTNAVGSTTPGEAL
jgi:hypothetical protein